MKKKIYIILAITTIILVNSCEDDKTNTKESDIVYDTVMTVPEEYSATKNDTFQEIVEDETDTFIPMAFRDYQVEEGEAVEVKEEVQKVDQSKQIEQNKETSKTTNKIIAVPPPPKTEAVTENVSAERKEKGRTDNTPETVTPDTVNNTPVKRKVKGR